MPPVIVDGQQLDPQLQLIRSMRRANAPGLVEPNVEAGRKRYRRETFVYRGIRRVSEEAINELRGDVARKLVKSGAMALIYAHLFYLGLTRELFGRQMEMALVPAPQPAA